MLIVSRPVNQTHGVSFQPDTEYRVANTGKACKVFDASPTTPTKTFQPSACPFWEVKSKQMMREWIDTYGSIHLPKRLFELFRANNLLACFSKHWPKKTFKTITDKPTQTSLTIRGLYQLAKEDDTSEGFAIEISDLTRTGPSIYTFVAKKCDQPIDLDEIELDVLRTMRTILKRRFIKPTEETV